MHACQLHYIKVRHVGSCFHHLSSTHLRHRHPIQLKFLAHYGDYKSCNPSPEGPRAWLTASCLCWDDHSGPAAVRQPGRWPDVQQQPLLQPVRVLRPWRRLLRHRMPERPMLLASLSWVRACSAIPTYYQIKVLLLYIISVCNMFTVCEDLGRARSICV